MEVDFRISFFFFSVFLLGYDVHVGRGRVRSEGWRERERERGRENENAPGSHGVF